MGSFAKTVVFIFGLKLKPPQLSLKPEINKMANCTLAITAEVLSNRRMQCGILLEFRE